MNLLAVVILLLALVLPTSARSQVTCPTTQSDPRFTAGGSVFGRTAAQWSQYFRGKVDANDGVLCNPTIVGGSVGISQLIGDCTAGPGAGSQGTTCLRTNGVLFGAAATAPSTLTLGSTTLTLGTTTTSISGLSLASLSAADATLTFSGSYDGSTARTVAVNQAGTFAWTGSHTFGQTYGGIGNGGAPVSGTPYTVAATDCGKFIIFTSNSAVTVTVPSAIVPASGVCPIGILQFGTAKVSVNGSAVTPATLISESGWTGTSGTRYSLLGLSLMTIGGTAYALLNGSGS